MPSNTFCSALFLLLMIAYEHFGGAQPGNANLPIGVPEVYHPELVARPLIVRNVSVRLKSGQGGHADARIPERALRILFNLRGIQATQTRAIRPGMLPSHDVRERFREISIFLRFLIETGENPVAPERHPDVVLRIGIALIAAAKLERILVLR